MSQASESSTILLADDVDLSGAWSSFWNSIIGPLSGIVDFLTIIGVILVVGSILAFFWKRHRGGGTGVGRDSGTVIWVLITGAILCAPNVLMPVFLNILDAIANALVNLVQRNT